MPTYLYCVLAPTSLEALPSGLRGIGGAPVRSLPFGASGELEAWVSSIGDAVLRATGSEVATQALMHNEVVNAALRTGRTPAPTRYGSYFSDDTACIADLDRRSAVLATILGRIADAVEMAVLLVPTSGAMANEAISPPASNEPTAGRRYLESIRRRVHESQRRRAAAEAEAGRLGCTVGRYIRGEARSIAATGMMSLAHLVRNADLAPYRNALAGFVPGGAFRLVIGGPRAPYSFSDSGLDRSGHDSGNHT
jgi:gas vesicle protein GvpL/GvpF